MRKYHCRPVTVSDFGSVVAFALIVHVATDAASILPWPHVCSGEDGQINQTRCPAGQTCCSNKFSLSTKGCCPWENAVCCDNQLTCCPSGTKCVDHTESGWPSWGVVTTCESVVKSSKDMGATSTGVVQGKCVCKPGPPLPASNTLQNVLIIGDSVSLGYTPTVANLMSDVALVQHAPWSADGGAEETAYGKQCVQQWLFSPNGTPYVADIVYFNWGLHDGPQLFKSPPVRVVICCSLNKVDWEFLEQANVTIPGQEGNMSVYAAELADITKQLQAYSAATGAKLIFALTSPMMASLRADQDVMELNRRAVQVMSSAGIPTVDLHAAIVGKCGPVPQMACFGADNCFSPHCAQAGYDWLAKSTIVPAIRTLL